MTSRFVVSGSAGNLGRRRYAVVDRQNRQGGKGMKRMSFHASISKAQAEAKRLNENERHA